MNSRMLNPRVLNEQRCVAVAIDKDKGSQHAFRWAADNLLMRGQSVTLIHVNVNHIQSPTPRSWENSVVSDGQESNDPSFDLFLPFRVFSSCKDVNCDPVTIEDNDVAKALIEYVSLYRIESLVLGGSPRNGISSLNRLFHKHDIPSTVLKGAPDFCNVFIISKGKVHSARRATRPLRSLSAGGGRLPPPLEPPRYNFNNNDANFKSPLPRVHPTEDRMADEVIVPKGEFSFPGSDRLSTDSNIVGSVYDNLGPLQSQRHTKGLSLDRQHIEPFFQGSNLADLGPPKHSAICTPENMQRSKQETKSEARAKEKIEKVEEKMRRLELQMNQTMEMYHAACKEALKEKQKAKELHLLRKEDERNLAEALCAKEEALENAEKEKAMRITAAEAAKAAQKKADKEEQMRKIAEKELLREAETTRLMLNSLDNTKTALKYQSLLRMLVVFIIFYFYFFELR